MDRDLSHASSSSLDLASALKTSQAISGEIVLEKLLAKLMHVAMENAGAQRCVLILEKSGRMTVAARTGADDAGDAAFESTPLEECSDVAAAIVHYIARTRETVVLESAADEGAFMHDEYIRNMRPLSVLGLPIVHQGELTGVLYLENNLIRGAFTAERLTVLELLTSQAAISIRNATLYDELRLAQADLVQEKNRLEAIVEAMPDGLSIQDLDYVITFQNDWLRERCGDALGEKCFHAYANCNEVCEGCPVKLAYADGDAHTLERQLVMSSGEEIPAECTANPIRDAEGEIVACLTLVRDLTERRRAEEMEASQEAQLRQADKMATLGTVVSGVAHEINNPNNFIMLNAKLLARMWGDLQPILDRQYEDNGAFSLAGIDYLRAKDRLSKMIEGLSEGGQRIERIVRELKDFARKGTGHLDEQVDVNAVVDSSLMIVGNLLKKTTRNLRVETADDLPTVQGNTQQIEQVVINLLTNAAQALGDPGRAIHLSTRTEGDSVLIVVTDEGEGIPPEEMKQVFDPFYTTKRGKGGTGLGLSVCYNIIQNHQGDLTLSSEPGKGTTATIRLPAGSTKT